MSEHRHSEREVAEVVRLLALVAGTMERVPSSDVIYWRAQVRLALDEASMQRRRTLHPIRLFQLAIGVGSIALAALVSVWPLFIRVSLGSAELLALPFSIAMVAVGAYLLAEAGHLHSANVVGWRDEAPRVSGGPAEG